VKIPVLSRTIAYEMREPLQRISALDIFMQDLFGLECHDPFSRREKPKIAQGEAQRNPGLRAPTSPPSRMAGAIQAANSAGFSNADR